MINIVCVKWGTKYSAEYVNILFDMVNRNLMEGDGRRYICFTDDPTGINEGIEIRPLPGNLEGWWNKLYLFKEGVFEEGERVAFFDLDTVIAGSLDEILAYEGDFAILRDFYRPNGLQSSIMLWKPKCLHGLWQLYEMEGCPQNIIGGDQAYIERALPGPHQQPDILQELFPRQFVSYKANCRDGLPANANVIVFHGEPRPHEVEDDWVKAMWKIGGVQRFDLEVVANTKSEEIEANVRHAVTLNSPAWLMEPVAPHNDHAVIVGGGPSLSGAHNLEEIRARKANGQKIFSTNGTYQWLVDRGIQPDCQVIMDARAENSRFVSGFRVDYGGCADTPEPLLLYCSTCHPDVFTEAADTGFPITLWHVATDETMKVLNEGDKKPCLVGAHGTVGLSTLGLAYLLGYREMHLYGFDSSYREDDHHAYEQKLNDGERIITVHVGEQEFKAAPWMVTQTNVFREIAAQLVGLGCTITVHGDGLLPYMAKMIQKPSQVDSDIAISSGVYWPSKDTECRFYHDATASDIEKIMDRCPNRNVAIQAGGNVGLWAKEFSKFFRGVYTFEPDYLNFRCLNLNVTEPNVVKFQAALGNTPAMIDLARDPANCGAHFVNGKGLVPTLRIDDLGLEVCDLIQLDIEGFELEALKGAEETIRAWKPTIVVEDKKLGERYGIADGAIQEWLAQFGYKPVAHYHRDVVFVSN